MVTLIDGAGALLLEDDTVMARPLPDPHTPIGHRRDGRPIFPILGADPTDPSNDLLGDPEQPPSASPTASGTVVDQESLSKLLAREKEQGGRSAVRKLVEQLGFGKAEDLAAFVKAQQAAETAQLTEVQRREKAAVDASAAAAAREAAAVAREKAAVRRAALVALGATGTDLADAERLLVVDDDADEQAVTGAATALKARRPELFGKTPTPAAAPGGSPAGGPPQRGSNVPKRGAAGAEMARRRGYTTKTT
ncbi:hypothetical protein OH809_25215 [Streptomyces sp. NBC_00873]|uniref:hypothetical protein n=1 Tax=Streptomyces sp. NBC_00873 TaxID=2975852 RepID=UPI003865C401|nr:hypothetical protein OH809_25215 [Streptomyces sp. NBC_00873]